MKTVKSLLLGTAAGLVAVAGAQAADLPVKAKPVEYVKVCSVYGEGFFYVPGTDSCIKIGGYVRQDFYFGQTGNSFAPDILDLGGSRFDRISTADSLAQMTTELSWDVRTQTEYGTLRAYVRGGFRVLETTFADGTYYTSAAFIQLGGFTVGRTQSFFNFMNGAFSFANVFTGGGSSTAFGTQLAAYTISWGGGINSSVAIEDPTMRRNGVWDGSFDPLATNALTIGTFPGPAITNPMGYTSCTAGCGIGDTAANSVPDIVSNIRIDQTWGSAQFMTAVHQVRAGFYGNNTVPTDPGFTGIAPRDEWGYAIGGGFTLNLPWNKGDKFWFELTYTKGAFAYTNGGEEQNNNSSFARFSGASGWFGQTVGTTAVIPGQVAFGWAMDGIFSNLTPAGTSTTTQIGLTESGLHLTTAWTIGSAYEHYWTPAVRTAFYGDVTFVSFDSTAKFILCNSPNSPIHSAASPTLAQNFGAANAPGATTVLPNPVLAGCNPNFDVWSVGARTVWNPVPNLDVGLDVMYSQIDNHFDPNLIRVIFPGSGGRQAGIYAPAGHEGVWAAMVRFQRNFWP
jgi:hypothetical protein